MISLSTFEEARIRGGRRVTGHVLRVRPGQAGRAIIDQARQMSASAIVMPVVRDGHASLTPPTRRCSPSARAA